MPDVNFLGPIGNTEFYEAAHGVFPSGDANTAWTDWLGFRACINKSLNAGQTFSTTIVGTYSLVYTGNAYIGGVLAPNGDIHFVPLSADRGQKISASGIVSTYSLVYTTTTAYGGGVLAPNGDIHFVPLSARVGQKISASGIVSTYSLILTTTSGYAGGVLSPSGDIHFIRYNASRGQVIFTNSANPFDFPTCASPYLNKF